MHSIRTKITVLTIAAILVSITAVGGIGIFTIKSQGDRSSECEMTLICANLQKSIDEYLENIEQSVDMVSRYADEELSTIELVEGDVIGANGTDLQPEKRDWDTEQQAALDEYLHDYTQKVERVFRSVANHTQGVITYYFRLNPEISRNETGFFYSKIGNPGFVETEVTDVFQYNMEDTEHMGWYTIPLQRGRPSWLNPYYNDNLKVKLFSYETPIYKAGTFIGIIGMDISYDTLVDQIDDVRVFRTGFACLMDENGTIVYHPTMESGMSLADIDPDLGVRAKNQLSYDHTTRLIHYDSSGVARAMAFQTLENGLKLLITAPVSEINSSWMSLINMIVLASVIIMIAFAVVTAAVMKRITKPLRQLTTASGLILAGNYDIELPDAGNDEVGILTATFQQLVNHLRIYIQDLNSKAYSDALTGVKNKGAFEVYARKIDDLIKLGKQNVKIEFAVIILDCNSLKFINDTYGHEKGDLYLRNACRMICRVFAHSPVFRLGGDEFGVLLQKQDYDNREALLREFDRRCEEINRDAEPWEKVSIARGVAVYDPERDTNVESVMVHADELMYQNKKHLKDAPHF